MNKLYRLCRYDWPIHFVLLFTNWLPDNVIFLRLRGLLLGPFFKQCGKNLRVGRDNVFCDSYDMIIGHNVYISRGNWFNATGGIYIGDEVIFGPNSIIVTSNHTRENGSFRYGVSKITPIKIEFGSWIGGNCTILPGSVVGKGTVIGANSVVNSAIPDDVVAAGNPAVIKKQFND